MKEVCQKHADLVKYYNDTAHLYYYQDKKDMPLTSHREVRDMRTPLLVETSISSLATSCPSSCSADGSRPHGSFQLATMALRTSSWTLAAALDALARSSISVLHWCGAFPDSR
eukprot:2353294-Amphidinium_carterae.1